MLYQHMLHMMMGMLSIFGIFLLIGAVIYIVPFWFIFKKAGFSPFLCLLLFFPLVNLVMIYVLAFSEWKVIPIGQAPALIPPRT